MEIPAERGHAKPFTRRLAHVISGTVITHPGAQPLLEAYLPKRRVELDARRGSSTDSKWAYVVRTAGYAGSRSSRRREFGLFPHGVDG